MNQSQIFIVDDSPLNLMVLTKIFEGQGFLTQGFPNGATCLAALETQVPDLALLDINLPDFSGFELAAKIKGDPRTKGIPVIFISSLSSSEDKVRAFETGASDYITKPFFKEEVLARVKTHLTVQSLQRELEHRIAELETLYKEVKDLSIRDALTGLYNRRYLSEILPTLESTHRRYKNSYTVIMSDLDRFKSINDTYGHGIGDEVLRRLAQILTRCTRDCDTVARYGGEEFIILLPETELEGALIVAERIRRTVEQSNWTDIHPGLTRVTLSLGVASCSSDPLKHPFELVEEADAKLYQAKKSGRNIVCS